MLDATPACRLDEPQQAVAHTHFAPQPSGSRPVWCVVASLPRSERTAHAELHRRGFQAYLPLLTVRLPNRHWRTGPLFVGYLFVRLRLDQPWNPVRYAPGVFSLLSIDGIPSICPDTAIEALQASEALRSVPTTRDDLYCPGAACEAILGGGQKVDAVVRAVNKGKATVIAVMFGALREMTVNIDNLRLRS